MIKKGKARKRRMKRMKMSFKDAILLEISEGRERDESSLVTAVAKKVFGVERTYGNMKRRSKSSIIQMGNKGLLKKRVLMSGGIRWSIRNPGEDAIIVSKTKPKNLNLKDLILLETARKNIATLETVLRNSFCSHFMVRYSTHWLLHISEPIRLDLIGIYERNIHRTPDYSNPSDVLSVAGIMDFFKIFRENMEMFSDLFIDGGEALQYKYHLRELALYRNKIQHNDELTQKELLYFNILSEITKDKFTES